MKPRRSQRRQRMARTPAGQILGDADASLLDVIDNVLNRGVVLTGEATLGVASVDLIYLRLSVLLCAADRLFSQTPPFLQKGER
jgi:gas vesicle protein GvpA/GvpJ/GvpM family